MRKNIRTLSFIFSGLLALGVVAPTFAFQSVRANVPFPFKAGRQDFPAGTYTMTWADDGAERVLEIRSRDGRAHGMVNVELGAEALTVPKTSKLEFLEVGGHRYLREVDVAGEIAVAEVGLPKSITERVDLDALHAGEARSDARR